MSDKPTRKEVKAARRVMDDVFGHNAEDEFFLKLEEDGRPSETTIQDVVRSFMPESHRSRSITISDGTKPHSDQELQETKAGEARFLRSTQADIGTLFDEMRKTPGLNNFGAADVQKVYMEYFEPQFVLDRRQATGRRAVRKAELSQETLDQYAPATQDQIMTAAFMYYFQNPDEVPEPGNQSPPLDTGALLFLSRAQTDAGLETWRNTAREKIMAAINTETNPDLITKIADLVPAHMITSDEMLHEQWQLRQEIADELTDIVYDAYGISDRPIEVLLTSDKAYMNNGAKSGMTVSSFKMQGEEGSMVLYNPWLELNVARDDIPRSTFTASFIGTVLHESIHQADKKVAEDAYQRRIGAGDPLFFHGSKLILSRTAISQLFSSGKQAEAGVYINGYEERVTDQEEEILRDHTINQVYPVVNVTPDGQKPQVESAGNDLPSPSVGNPSSPAQPSK